MSIVLETEKSALILHDIEQEIIDLLKKSVEEIDSTLNNHPEIIIFDRVCKQHRSIGFYSNESKGYKYSGSISESKPLTPSLKKLLTFINDKFGSGFNGILVNKYENGSEYIGKHSDDEKGLDPKFGVISMSFGSVRKFRIRDKKTGKILLDLPTDQNKIIQMSGDFQKEFTHEIPVEKKIKETRFSFTFRKHIE